MYLWKLGSNLWQSRESDTIIEGKNKIQFLMYEMLIYIKLFQSRQEPGIVKIISPFFLHAGL